MAITYRIVKGDELTYEEGDENISFLDTTKISKPATPTSGHFLKWNGTAWVSAAVTSTDVGLGNVNNTSDASKPISTSTQTALNGKQMKATGTSTPGYAIISTSLDADVAPQWGQVIHDTLDNALGLDVNFKLHMNKAPFVLPGLQLLADRSYNHRITLGDHSTVTIIDAEDGDILTLVVRSTGGPYELILVDNDERDIWFEGGPQGGTPGSVPLTQDAGKWDIVIMRVFEATIFVNVIKDYSA